MLTQLHRTWEMEHWTDFEVRSMFYFLFQPEAMNRHHKKAVTRVKNKIQHENFARGGTA